MSNKLDKYKRKLKTLIFRKKSLVKKEYKVFTHKAKHTKLMHWTYPKKIFLGMLIILLVGACLLYAPISFNYESYSYVNNKFIFNFKDNDIDRLMGVNNKNVEYNFLDAIFMASSAFTDTGFSLFTVGTQLSVFGQIVIFVLIQIGGFGYISLFYLIGRAIRRITQKDYFSTSLLNIERGGTKMSNSSTMIAKIFVIIFVIQIAFAFFMSGILYSHPFKIQESWSHFISNVTDGFRIMINGQYVTGWESQTDNFNKLVSLSFDNTEGLNIPSYHNYPIAFWHALFLSGSAINNAGFDLFGATSLELFRNDMGLVIQSLVIILIIIGGIGFPIIYDLSLWIEWHCYKRFFGNSSDKPKFSSFTKMCLWSSIIVTFFSVAILFTTEYINDYSLNHVYQMATHNTLSLANFPDVIILKETTTNNSEIYHSINFFGENPTLNKNFSIIFTSISTRSAGFATVNMMNFTEASIVFMSLLMFIGASPSSTGGGVRTTTLWVIWQSLLSWLRGLEKTSYAKRRIPSKTVLNAYLVLVISILLLLIVSLIIYVTSQININGNNLIEDELNNKLILYSFSYFFFECASAFGTTGLSIGISNSQYLQWWNALLLIFLMFIGQLGISSTLLIFARKVPKRNESNYLEQDIKIG